MSNVKTYRNQDMLKEDGGEVTIPLQGKAGDTVRLFIWQKATDITQFVFIL